MKKILIVAVLMFFNFSNFSQTFTISANKRYVLKNEKPFIWIGDTAWELFHRLDREEAEFYLKKRANQGFTVIQAVVLAEMDGLNVPNPYGEKPLINDDPIQPNNAYFEHVDFIIDKANELGLTIALLPTWGDKVNKMQWGKGPEIFNVNNAKIYGKWIGTRYKNRKNIIWILGGDRNPRNGSNDVEIWRAMADGIAEGVGGHENALISYHSQPNQEGSSEWFHQETWFDFNIFQTGHCRDTQSFDYINKAYNRFPIKPVIDGEPIYEDHPVCFNANDLGTSNAYDVRKSAYLHTFSGAFGHTYGCHDIWQFYSPKREPLNNPHLFWNQALDLPGANQMKFLKQLLESRSVLDRIPDQSLIIENNLNASLRIQATKGNDFAFIYTAAGLPFTVNLGKISGDKVVGHWFNPKNGKQTEIEKFNNLGAKKFTPPSSGYGQDWVLILDSIN